jgi:putative phosphoesterase
MQLAVLADIHGNLPALEAVLADMQSFDIDGIIVAGDSIGGPDPVGTFRLLRCHDVRMIRGNSEEYFLVFDRGAAPRAWHTSDQWATMRWLYHRLDRETLDYIASLPEQLVTRLDGVAPVRVVHGTLQSAKQHLVPTQDPVAVHAFEQAHLPLSSPLAIRVDQAASQCSESVLVCGHSHIAWQWEGNGRLALNPGSVGAPINGDWRAQYALLTWQDDRWMATLRAVEYDLDWIRAAYESSGLLAAGGAFSRAYLRGIETGRNYPGFFLAHLRGLAADAGYANSAVVPDEVWDRAVATFDWD